MIEEIINTSPKPVVPTLRKMELFDVEEFPIERFDSVVTSSYKYGKIWMKKFSCSADWFMRVIVVKRLK